MSSALLSLASDPRLVFAGWTLLVTLWATSAVGILLAVWRAWWPGASAGAQHTAAVVAFGLALTLAAGTPFALLAVPASADPVGGRPVIEPVPHLADPRASSAPAQSVATPASANNGLRLEVLAGAAAILWMVGVVLLGLRLAGGLLVAHSIRRRSHPLADEAALAVAASLQKSLDVPGQVLLLESSELESPAVIGWRTPALILPVDVSGQLTAEMTSGLIAHELAHIRRRDYVVNVIQSEVRYANGVAWSIEPNAAAFNGSDALGVLRPWLPRELLSRDTDRRTAPASQCRDSQGRSYSLGARVPVLNEPGVFGRCDGGRWIEAVLR